jgi:hypothetical protein
VANFWSRNVANTLQRRARVGLLDQRSRLASARCRIQLEPGCPMLARPAAKSLLTRLERRAVRDAVEPCPQRAALVHPQGCRPADEYQKRRLERVFGRMTLAEYLAADGQDRRPVPGRDHLERRLGSVVRALTTARIGGGEPVQELAVGEADGGTRAEQPPKVPACGHRSSARHVGFPRSVFSDDLTTSFLLLLADRWRDSVFKEE